MSGDWDSMWAKPFDDAAHYATAHLVDGPFNCLQKGLVGMGQRDQQVQQGW